MILLKPLKSNSRKFEIQLELRTTLTTLFITDFVDIYIKYLQLTIKIPIVLNIINCS